VARVTATGPIPIVKLDVPSLADAKELVTRLGPACDFYKVGLQLFTAEGPAAVEWLRAQSKRVFLDLKLHDIPNTVAEAAVSASALGAELITVHAAAGEAALRAAVEGAARGGGAGILAVTVLTSLDDAAYSAAIDFPGVAVSYAVTRFAARAAACGARGVVCGGAEVSAIRHAHGDRLGVLVPGLRESGGAKHDQARTTTPERARDDGATWVVVGRIVTEAADPADAFGRVSATLRRSNSPK
jgi:orotidine-5'-phosphate decarboxylase